MHRTGTYNVRHNHGTGTTAGYLVVRTDWTDGFPCTRTVVAEVEGSTNYGRVLELVREVRSAATDKQYGVIATVYTCGCDSEAYEGFQAV